MTHLVVAGDVTEKMRPFDGSKKGYEQRSSGMLYLTTDPFWSEMRSDPRYADLLRRMAGTPTERLT